MTEGQIRFQVMVEAYPQIACYWDFESREAKVSSSEGLPLSRGERLMVDFFLSVWFNRNQNFDFIDAAGVLSSDNKHVIMEWFLAPFWP